MAHERFSKDGFHPSIKNLVSDYHREYAFWARATYRSIGDIPGVDDSLHVADTVAGDQVRF